MKPPAQMTMRPSLTGILDVLVARSCVCAMLSPSSFCRLPC